PGGAHLCWHVSLYTLHHSRGATEPLSAACTLLSAHRLRAGTRVALLLDVGASLRGPDDQGADCSHLFLRRSHSLPADHRPVAALARDEAGRRPDDFPGHLRALAHSLRAG